AAIQEVFEEHITGAPGMEKVKELVRRKLMPTPGAVMNACKLLYGEIGDLMVVDVGGATTDVHSVTAGGGDDAPGVSNTEPLAKRTVEGDLGIYANRESLIREVGWMELSKELGFDVRPVSGSMGPIPSSSEELALSVRLTFEAARIALDRHAGRVKLRCGAGGPVRVPLGRDLSRVKWIIGTGGALVRLPGGREALEQLKATGGGPRSGSGRPGSLGTGGWDPAEERMLPSEEARVVLDGDYIMAQAGVLAARFPGAALSLLRASLGL
ncbi:MAG: glutamate mutase L, partial [Firmicutes bacterium]|nr:glutamate mutase L [Bacillota bacterium]